MEKAILELLITSLGLCSEYTKSTHIVDVIKAIDNLTDEDKEIIRKAYVEHWSHVEADTFEDIINHHFPEYPYRKSAGYPPYN